MRAGGGLRAKLDIPIRHDSDPTCFAPITRAQPNIVLARPSDLNREVCPEAITVRRLGIKPVSQIRKTLLGVLSRDGPFERVLRELGLDGK